MTDQEILARLWAREDDALSSITARYGNYLLSIAENILGSGEDARECLNDTLFKAWNAIPPMHPENLRTYLGRIIRNLALNRLQASRAEKRIGDGAALLRELEDCIPGGVRPEAALEEKELVSALNLFLSKLPAQKRSLFLRRYWFGDSLAQIAQHTGKSQAAAAMALSRLRRELKDFLKERGYEL